MPLAPNTRIGVYKITAQIGEGGMGQVYRARDTKLNRDVALKVLPESFAANADRLARFTREAQTLASLNHPNIAHIHGLEESQGVSALVMELVDGEDLSERIARGAIAIDQALAIAKQIADAVEAAHEQGIIHRDLKPANIKVRADGMVKVLDFGLAKATHGAVAGEQDAADVSVAATMAAPAVTMAGMILGTAAYMSPEQARGLAVDRRTDIWAFGVVLYEMLTGTRAFEGEVISDTLARVIEREPAWDRLPATLSPALRTYLERCLRKDPRQRLRDIGDMRLALEGAFEIAAPQTTSPPAAAPRGGLTGIALGVAVAGLVALAIPAVQHLRESSPAERLETRLDIVTPPTAEPGSFALSPDGRQIVFVASSDGASLLFLRPLAATAAQPLPGTEGATFPFWSPDGRSIGFFAGSALKRLDLGGGARTLAPAVLGTGTWNADGVVLFSPTSWGPLMQMSANGGTPTAVTSLGPQQQGHFAPHFLPDGRRFLFSVSGSPEVAGIYLGTLDSRATARLVPASNADMYVTVGWYLPANQLSLPAGATPTGASREDGWLLWVRERTTLVAQPLNVITGALTGEPVPIANNVVGVSVAGGMMAYRTGVDSQRQLTWVDRSGAVRDTLGEPATFALPRVAPDGRRVAVTRVMQGNMDIWLFDAARTSRFTFDATFDSYPVWSPDGSRIAFNSPRTGQSDLYVKAASGGGAEERILTSDQNKVATSWSADGRFLIYFSIDPQTRHDLWVVPLAGDRTPSVFLKTPFAERHGAFSPDGRWVAYQSDESGQNEIWVRPFLSPGSPGASSADSRWQISTAGGIMPAWRPDGKELYYLDSAGSMMAVSIRSDGTTLDAGAPVMLFATRIAGGGVDAQQGRQYDLAPDGRFLINTIVEDQATSPITLLQHWDPAGRK